MTKILKTTALASVLALSAAGAVTAGSLQDPIVEPDPIVIVDAGRDWSGAYLGISGVYGLYFTPGPTGSYYGVGAHAGYLSDMGDYVIGGEVNYEFVVPDFAPPNLHRLGADLILGYDAGDFLPHVTAGVAGLTPSGGGGWFYGASAGAGVSIMATDNIILTGRYRYTYYPNLGGGMSAHAFKAMASYKF